MAFRNRLKDLIESDKEGDGKADILQEGELPNAAYIKRHWKRGLETRRITDREAWTNLAFISGDHYSVWDPFTRRFQTNQTNYQDRSVRLKVNLIKDLWRGEVSNMVSGKPIPQVLPLTAEESDRMAAMAGQRILDGELHRLMFPHKRLENAMWVTSSGLSYMHPWWDSSDSKQGNVKLDVVPHFEVVQDPLCRFSVQEGNWVIHGRVLTVEEAYERFGEVFKATEEDTPYQWSQMFIGGAAKSTNTKRKGVLVLRMWHKRTNRFPEGFVRTAVNGRIVEDIPRFPYDHNELPFVDFHHIRLPGRFEGQSMITDLVPLQKDYNQSRSRQAEVRKLLTNPGWLAAYGSLDIDKITNTPNEVIEYNIVGPFKPERLAPVNVPNFIFQTADVARAEMQDIAGSHDASQGKAPASASGAAVIALQEKDNSKLSTTLMQQEQGIARVGQQVLGLVRQFWTTQRAVSAWHEELNESGVTFFKGDDLEGSIFVEVVPGSSMPKSQAQIKDTLLQLFDHKVITDASMVLKQMELPNTDQMIDLLSVDSRQAKREHDRMFAGETEDMIVVEAWHNHMEHINTHNNFRKTETFEKWPPGLRQLLSDHVEQHYEYAMQQRQYYVDMAVQEQVAAQSQMAAAFDEATGGTQKLQGRLYMNPPAGMPAGPGGATPQPNQGSVPQPGQPPAGGPPGANVPPPMPPH